ncbi:MAG TPA: AmmeMemoRadiSam system radical SAM enzyme [Desulfosalsimonadaceae bacterium]|nr:AmmeMemoRadiSam system radical SAM enzyme [Desulfosalsimonadaceae bacterium]
MTSISRRKFLSAGVCAFGACMLPCSAIPSFAGKKRPSDISGTIFPGDAPEKLWKWSREAEFYEKLPDGRVMCGICPNGCTLDTGDRSVCRSRVNMDGKLYTLAYGNPCAIHVDPIEKKPLFHFHPRSKALSIAATGCNFRCLNCQNWQISQAKPEAVRHRDLFPKAVVEKAGQYQARSIAYTYSEPTTFYEYMIDTADLARQQGLFNLWISNGYIRQKPLEKLCRVIDGANVNLKSFSDDLYHKLNGGRLQPVLDTFITLHRQGVHFEMTTLVVPGYVDDPEMIKSMCGWIVENLGQDHPLHFLRFFPRYKLDRLPPTPVSRLTEFRKLAMQEGIRYVYVGNVPGHEGCHTYCHNCGRLLIRRAGFQIPEYHLEGSRCRFCGTAIPGVWGEEKP